MPYDPARHHRRSIRLQGYDYTRPGAYFVTIVTQGRACLFGEVMAGEMRMNDAGRMIHHVWDELALFYEGVQTDAFIVMPNHVHGIIILTGNVRATPRGCPNPQSAPTAPTHPPSGQPHSPMGQPHSPMGQPHSPMGQPHSPMGQPHSPMGQPRGVAPTAAPTLGLPDVVHRFKTLTTKRYADGVRANQWPPFPGRLWQRNYYEHIIRDDQAWQRIREYILTNPLRWHLDRERDIGVDPSDVIGDGA
ncbi:transposase [Chloracidobacterium thermophilum]|uniref:transposase n=1 Tax=Chloracidobacterium thermophilum TaxID=458033 RepID=UPI0007C76FE7|nr:transposase [Chloracidobacterium thermophilum]